MALFGDLGKALGLGSGKDILPLIGSAAGFYFGGPLGASLGSGIGTLATGGRVDDVLKNAALAYGVGSLVSPNLMSAGAQANTGMFGSNALQRSLYNVPRAVQSAGVTPVTLKNMGTISDADLYDAAMSGAGGAAKKGSGLFGDIGVSDVLMGGSLLGGLFGSEEEDDTTERPWAEGKAWKVTYKGIEYDLSDPDEKEAYKQAKEEDMYPGYAHGGAMVDHPDAYGAMYEHKKMGYDVAVRGEVSGPGTGTSDSVPARLSDGEFVLTAKAVRGAGGGDRDVGAARLYDMMAELEATA